MQEVTITLAPSRRPLRVWARALAVLGLAWIAGYVDAVGYLALLGVYTSHMSGNTAAIGRYFANADWRYALQHAWPLIAFVIGLIAGATAMEWARRRKYHSRLSLVMAAEIILLAILAQADPRAAASTAWLGLPALAMGMQTVTVTRVGEQRVYSTFLTGSLSKFGEALAGYGFWLADRARNHRKPGRHAGWLSGSEGTKLLRHAWLNGGLWALFLLGALSGTLVERETGLQALWWPIAGLIVLVALDWWRPISPIKEDEPLGFEA